MVWIVEGVGKRIAEHGGGPLEGDAMFGKISGGLLLISELIMKMAGGEARFYWIGLWRERPESCIKRAYLES